MLPGFYISFLSRISQVTVTCSRTGCAQRHVLVHLCFMHCLFGIGHQTCLLKLPNEHDQRVYGSCEVSCDI